jgi:hypothetical protein
MLQDRITLIYTDTPYGFRENVEIISKYSLNSPDDGTPCCTSINLIGSCKVPLN